MRSTRRKRDEPADAAVPHREADPYLQPGLTAAEYEAEAERSMAALFDPTVKARRRRTLGDILVLVALADAAG